MWSASIEKCSSIFIRTLCTCTYIQKHILQCIHTQHIDIKAYINGYIQACIYKYTHYMNIHSYIQTYIMCMHIKLLSFYTYIVTYIRTYSRAYMQTYIYTHIVKYIHASILTYIHIYLYKAHIHTDIQAYAITNKHTAIH